MDFDFEQRMETRNGQGFDDELKECGAYLVGRVGGQLHTWLKRTGRLRLHERSDDHQPLDLVNRS